MKCEYALPGGHMPAQHDISPEIKAFIAQHVRSVGHLEALLLLARERTKLWTATDLSSELRTNPSYAQDQLDELTSTGVVQYEPNAKAYHFNPEIDSEILDQLELAYKVKRTTIINLIYNQPMERIRSFADAFRIKKD